jgi:hypothetical protein
MPKLFQNSAADIVERWSEALRDPNIIEPRTQILTFSLNIPHPAYYVRGSILLEPLTSPTNFVYVVVVRVSDRS